MKVAFATQDLERVDAHFGWAKNIAFYEVTVDSYTFIESISFGGDLQEDGDEDKLGPKVAALKGCSILYVAAIGGSGATRVVSQNIHPLKVPQPEKIGDLLDNLQVAMRSSPRPPWLRKVLSKTGERTFDFEEETENA
ncbi:nitrogen fixation protein NifX [Methylocystis parvus]|uniref:Nitrogen fixation protein NifX n=1 Tax=Methylocystis parvus TaxID=134 RepID=A0A6B8M557_9HYPH|nr:nitrogen fixation protein NifX [Methylocystis parvus]QGM97538.1 nitrogen fixation protein NifX [Methylocystis parvus]WBJ98536.1 nitrogen fixation protein NifX [Methylocystis parvus OBBP]